MNRRPTDSRPAPEASAACAAAVNSRLLADHAEAEKRGSPLLTPAGVRHVRKQLRTASGPTADPPGEAARPNWDTVNGLLWFDRELVHELKKADSAVAAILDACQATRWAPEPIPNPLPRLPGESSEDHRKRLANAVGNLNRVVSGSSMHFLLTRNKQGVRWEYLKPGKRRRKRPR